MDADNFVGPAPYGQWVAVVNGVVVGYFLSQAEAERAYRAARGEVEPSPATGDYPAVTLDCGQGQGAPVNGGCWCCIAGQWQTDPKFCSDPTWAARCGNAGGGGSGGTVPQPGAPTSPGSGPSIPGGSAPSPAPRLIDVDTIARAAGVTRGELVALAGIAAAVLILR